MTRESAATSKVIVVQSIGAWLTKTMVWLYDQVTSLGDGVESHVVCEQTTELETFRVPNINCLSNDYPLRSRIERAVRKANLRGGLPVKRKIIRQVGADLLHSHFGNYGWGDMEVARTERVGHIVTFYGMDVNKLPQGDPRWLRRYADLFQHADRFLCEGPHMGTCLEKMGCDKRKITVHHLGVRTSEIRYHRRTTVPGAPLRVLLCASFVEKKGLPYAIQALGEIARESPLEATLVGGPTGNPEHEPEHARIRQTIADSGLGDRLKCTGFLPYDRLIEESYTHDIFLSPSVTASDGDTEGGAPVTIAAMAATGIAIVSSTHCDIPEIVQHGRSAFLAGERDAPSLAALLRTFRGHPELRLEFGVAARQRMEAEFDCSAQGLKLAEIYRTVKEGRQRRTGLR